jgi:hypothetical protein
MKKMMGLVLGLSLAVGAFSFAFAQDGGSTTKQTGKKGKGSGGKKNKDTTK